MSVARKKSHNWMIYVAVIVTIIVATFLILSYIYTGDTIRKGIIIEETDVSWLSTEDARFAVSSDLRDSFIGSKLTLMYGERKWDVEPNDIDYGFQIEDAVQQAFSVGREGSVFQNLYDSILISRNGHQLEVEENFDRQKLRNILTAIKKECDSEARNAEIAYVDRKFSFKHEQNYRNLDVDRNLKLVENQLLKRDFNDIELVVEEKEPDIIYDKIKDINSVISSYSTKFNKNDKNRTENIRLACTRIDNKLLMPGDAFSMNKELGPRTKDNGYKTAPIIFKNEYVPGTGGGVCQVSSTMYNSVLLAGLDVIEREHHSLPLSYISPGRDATVTEESIDFRFVNSLDYPILISAKVTGNKLSIDILGKKSDTHLKYKLRTKTIGAYKPKPDSIILDDTLPYGKEVVERKASKGIRVILYRDTYKDGKLQWSEKLTEDYYRPVQGVKKVSSDLYRQYQEYASAQNK